MIKMFSRLIKRFVAIFVVAAIFEAVRRYNILLGVMRNLGDIVKQRRKL